MKNFRKPGKLNGPLFGPYYFGGSNWSPPQLNFDQMMSQAQQSASYAQEQSSLAHAQALEMEATRNAYATAITDRETQNEAQLEAQQQSMESLLSDVTQGMRDEDEKGISPTGFFTSLMSAMQAGTSNTQAGAPTGGPITAAGKTNPTAIGQNIYGSSARPV